MTSHEADFEPPGNRSLKQWINYLIVNEGFEEGDLSVVFTTDEYLLSLNMQYLDKDYYTDVITFDYREGNIISGDVIISIDRVKENSEMYGEGFYRELCRIIAHGILHIIGYNDNDDKNRLIMREKETYYLDKACFQGLI
ncbi:MAG: rRNA maturation RNase YbeY [Marinilabiliales bacterium]|nr:MAG: rRNA maturation RNase YbeY [Marinilabiliales bacterium]